MGELQDLFRLLKCTRKIGIRAEPRIQAHQSNFTQREPKKQSWIHLKCVGKVQGVIHDLGAVHKDGRQNTKTWETERGSWKLWVKQKGNPSRQRLPNGPLREEDIESNTTSPPSLLPVFLLAVLDSPTVCSLSSAARKLKVSPAQLAGAFCKGASLISSRAHLYGITSSQLFLRTVTGDWRFNI